MTLASTGVPAHAPVEIVLPGPAGGVPGNPTPVEVALEGPSGAVTVPGFWDGGDRYVARFLPEREGHWEWRSVSAEPGLDGRTGRVTVSGAAGPGVVRPAHRFHFAHADGTPFRPVGATVYNWLHQGPARVSETLDAVAGAGFTKLRFLVFPQAGDHVVGEPDLLPFARRPDGSWDPSRPVVAFFRRLDDAVRLLGERGIQADLLLLTAYDGGRYGLDALSEDEEETYLRYVVARLSAFPNVWWSLCNEFDLLDRPRARWRRAGELLRDIDPVGHLRSIHNWIELYDATEDWITHASIQNGQAVEELGRAGTYRDVYRKPVVLDEVKYEGDTAERWGHLEARELVHRFWVAAVSGVYASHGESYLRPDGDLHIVGGGAYRGASPARLGFLRRVLDELVVPGLDPVDKWDDPEFVAGWPPTQYLRYLGRRCGPDWGFRLPQASHVGERLKVGMRFRVEILDTWRMTVSPVPGEFVLDEVARNDAWARAAARVALPEGEAIALRITRVAE